MAAGEEDDTERARRPSGKKPAKKAVRKTGTGRVADRTGEGETKRAAHRVSAPRAMRNASEQLQELLGRAPSPSRR